MALKLDQKSIITCITHFFSHFHDSVQKIYAFHATRMKIISRIHVDFLFVKVFFYDNFSSADNEMVLSEQLTMSTTDHHINLQFPHQLKITAMMFDRILKTSTFQLKYATGVEGVWKDYKDELSGDPTVGFLHRYLL